MTAAAHPGVGLVCTAGAAGAFPPPVGFLLRDLVFYVLAASASFPAFPGWPDAGAAGASWRNGHVAPSRQLPLLPWPVGALRRVPALAPLSGIGVGPVLPLAALRGAAASPPERKSRHPKGRPRLVLGLCSCSGLEGLLSRSGHRGLPSSCLIHPFSPQASPGRSRHRNDAKATPCDCCPGG